MILLQCPQYSTSRCCLLQMFITWSAGAMHYETNKKKKERDHLIGYCAYSILIGCKWTAEEGQVQACLVAKFLSPPFSLSSFSHSFTDRNFDRTSVRSRSFRRLNRAFSVLRRTKSGTAVANETEEQDNIRNTNIPPEGECVSCKYCIWAFVSWSSWKDG